MKPDPFVYPGPKRQNAKGNPQNQKPVSRPLRRRRYRTRMFDNRLSFPTTSEQVHQLQAESDAEGRSVASLIREAIDRFLPRLRKRRRSGTAQTPAPDRAAAGEGRFEQKARRLLGDPEERTAREWHYGSLRIDLKTGLWKDSETGKVGNFLELIQRELKTDQAGAIKWLQEKPPE